MTPPLLIDGNTLTLPDVIEVARHSRSVVLSDAACERMAAARAWVDRVVETGQPTVYGINTGFGIFAARHIPIDQSDRLSRNLIISHAIGIGEPFPEEVVRAAMLIRANTLAIGHSGIRPETVQTLLEMLNAGVHPIIPSQGSLGASGDLAPLSHLALVLSRDPIDDALFSGEALYRGERLPGQVAMQRAGIQRRVLGAKEALALNNGATFCAAIAALAICDAENLLEHGIVALAMSLEALRGVSRAFDAHLHRARRQVGQVAVAARVRELIAGSTLIDATDRVQDAYSLRAAPQVLGAVQDSLAHVRSIVERELNAATDNPLIFLDLTDENKALSGGNFHGEPIALAANFLSIAAAEIASISERRLARLLDEATSDGLPAMLVEHGGLDSGLMMAQYTAASLVSENKTLAHPDVVDSIPTSANQEDFNPMAMAAARHARQIVAHGEQVIALELLAAAQALDLRLRADAQVRFGQGTARAYQIIRHEVSYLERDRLIGEDVRRMVKLVRKGRILKDEG
ncbi:histidine ammonia-lyase [Thermoflexales bacterium]|nr:histidine ammonia-lyase [Thermoflexales bacterium]